jgi:hypothetical protein
MKRETNEQFFERLINKMFEIAGHDMNYATLVENKEKEDEMPFGERWYQRYTWNTEQEAEFSTWAKNEMKKRFKYMNERKRGQELGMFLLGYGLKRNDYDFEK